MSVFFLLLFNFLISCLNAYSVGLAWYDSKAQGWFARFVNACALVMSMCGFTYVYAAVLAIAADKFEFLPHEYATGILQIVYLMIIVPVIGSGLGITLHSILQAWRTRSILDTATATYNTFAQTYNTYTAFSEIGDALSAVSGLFPSGRSSSSSSSSDDDDSGFFFVIMLAIVALSAFSGIITTIVIASKAAESQSLSVRQELRDLRHSRG